MKFVYVGDEDRKTEDGKTISMDPPKTTKVYGVEFELNGKPQEVPKQYERKFLGNKCFEVYEEKPEVKQETESKPRGRPKKTV